MHVHKGAVPIGSVRDHRGLYASDVEPGTACPWCGRGSELFSSMRKVRQRGV